MVSCAFNGAEAGEVANTVKDVKLVTPYIWEVFAVLCIPAALTILNKIKKIRWFPLFLCRVKQSKPDKNKNIWSYRQLKSGYLDSISAIMIFSGVLYCLMQSYDDIEQMAVVAVIIVVLHNRVLKAIFAHAKNTKFADAAAAFKGNLYVSDDATVMAKVVAVATGGGVEKKK